MPPCSVWARTCSPPASRARTSRSHRRTRRSGYAALATPRDDSWRLLADMERLPGRDTEGIAPGCLGAHARVVDGRLASGAPRDFEIVPDQTRSVRHGASHAKPLGCPTCLPSKEEETTRAWSNCPR